MKIAHNKVSIDNITKKQIRSLFFKRIEMRDIEAKTGLTERVIRRVVNENNWIKARERYLRFLCSLSYIRKISLEKMAKIAMVNRYVLGRVRRKYNTPKPQMIAWNKRINNDIENKFISEYNGGAPSQAIANKYGFKTNKTVLDVLKKNMVNRRPPKIQTYYREDFFSKIDSPEKAYILGLIMTDGYIIKDYSGFGIQLTKSDGYLLEKIALIIGAKQGVSQIICNAKRRVMPNAKDMTRLTVHNRKIAKDLNCLGITRNKSKALRYNNCVPKKYLSHLFRGLIDGDGTVGVAKNKNIWCQLSSASKKFINDLLLLRIPFTLKLNTSIVRYYSGKNKIIKECKMYVARVSGGNKETVRFLKWLYSDKGDLYLRRKYAKVQNKVN